jgi:tetratricopeptide (TPR) repeat protein
VEKITFVFAGFDERKEKFMAKRRLNKKVALIGSVVFVFFILGAILLFLYLSRDPEKFIKDGNAAIKAAREAIDERIKEQEYKKAERSYHEAYTLAKTDPIKIEMLFKLVDMYIETDQWRNVHGCWNKIIQIDPKNIKARFGRLKYVYIMADSTGGQVWQWQEVELQASELIEVVESMGLLMEDITKWESFGTQESRAGMEQIGPYLYRLRGRALLEITKLGAVTDLDASLLRAIDDLEKARELEPTNVDTYFYLAQTIITKGEILASKGNLEERDKTRKQAKELLEQAVEIIPTDVRAHINLLTMKSMLVQADDAEQIQSLEPEYLSLVDKFDSSAQAFSALAGFYSRLGHKYLDNAIEAAEVAVELDRESVVYATNAADLHYHRFSIYGQKPDIYKAIEVAKNALTLPDAQDKPGPRQGANKMNRISLYFFLANCYIEQVLEPCEVRTEAESKEWLADAEQVVHEIEQLLGSGEDPHVIKWQGMLELAKGNRNIAIRKLYAAYEQLKASKPPEPPWPRDPQFAQLSYALAKVFRNTSEVGAVREFLRSALLSGIDRTKPEALLDYADVLLKLRGYSAALGTVDFFENEYWTNERSQTHRIKIYIAANQFKEAEEELARKQPDDPNTIKLNMALVQAKIEQLQKAIAQRKMKENLGAVLRKIPGSEKEEGKSQAAELKRYNLLRAELLGKLLLMKPDSVEESSVVVVCNNYIVEGKTEQAKNLINRFLQYFPANTTALFYKHILSEPEPGKIPQQKRKEIEEQVLSGIADPIEKSMRLGTFYVRNDELNEAAGELKKVLGVLLAEGRETEALQESTVEKPVFDQTKEITDSQRLTADYLFEIALRMRDWELAEQLIEASRHENLDGCEGQFFAARLAMAKGGYEKALAGLEECLRQRPVFSRAFILRSNVNAALGNEHASIKDAQKAASLNPFDRTIARQLALALYRRNEKLGDNASSNQIIEARDALDRAMALNTGDLELLSFYAEYIVTTQPLNALAIRQRLQKTAPSMQNAVLLGRMATRLASEEKDVERREALFAIAASSFEQAKKIDPHDRLMLVNYAEYFRASGQEEKAKQLLQESEDQKLLWVHYFQAGRFEDAKKVLEQLYQTEQKDEDTVKGLLLVAEKTADKEAIKKYSEEILSLEDTVENRLFQIQTFLSVGLIKEAEYKLQSLKEKFPDETRVLLLEAWLAMKQGQLKRALELANRNLETSQDNAIAWRLRGEINLLMANYDQAIIDLKRSKSLSAEPLTRLSLAKAYQRAGRDEDAITELKSTVDHPQAPIQARMLLEQIYFQLGRKEALKEFYDETLRKFPDSVHWHNRAGAFAIAEGEVDRAEQLFKQAWQKAKKMDTDEAAAALDGYLRALITGEKLNKVFEEAGKYVDGDFAPIAFIAMAEAKLKLDDKESAIQYFRKAVDKAGTNEIFVSNILQRMYSLLGAEEVLIYCKERLKANPDSLAANVAMFNLKSMNGEYNNAVDYIDKCLQIIGPDSPYRNSYIMKKAQVLTLAYKKTSDNNYLKKAVIEYESLLAKVPNNPNVLNNLAYMLAEGNVRLGEALEYSKRACEARPNSPGFLDTYSYILYKNGRLSEAAESLQSALQQYEQSRISAPAEVYEHLGMIKEELGSEDEALAAYKQALKIGVDELSEVATERIESAIKRLRSQGEK